MQSYFYELADFAESLLKAHEVLLLGFNGEESSFVRFNRSAVRQAGAVEQRNLALHLIAHRRRVIIDVTASGDAALDRDRIRKAIEDARERLGIVPEDPFLHYATENRSTESGHPNRLPEDEGQVVESIVAAGEGRDLVGIYMAGGIHRGFANSLGQRNWFSTFSHHFDWSFYLDGDKAVKCAYAGFVWNPAEFEERVARAATELEALRHPSRTLEPGHYRVYLAPQALEEVVGLLRWGGFGLTAHRTRRTPLLRMITGDAALDSSVSMVEDTRAGLTANFDDAGFIKPDQVTLIDQGRFEEPLVSPRAAKEYGVPANGAGQRESPDSLVMAGGVIPRQDVLATLGTGIFINNLWYLNYSDRDACRMTGMTRFAAFWVENGEVKAPINVMRFDETLYRMLGDKLVGLTREVDLLPDSNSYGGRSTRSLRLPGALVDDFALTL